MLQTSVERHINRGASKTSLSQKIAVLAGNLLYWHHLIRWNDAWDGPLAMSALTAFWGAGSLTFALTLGTQREGWGIPFFGIVVTYLAVTALLWRRRHMDRHPDLH